MKHPSSPSSLSRGTGRPSGGPRGFTLIELMVAVALAGIVLTVGATFASRPRSAAQLKRNLATTQMLFEELAGASRSTGRAMLVVAQESNVAAEDGGGGRGDGIGRFDVWVSPDNSCRGGSTIGMSAYLPNPSVTFDHLGAANKQVALMRIEPANSDGVASICVLPTGRLMDATTGAPFAAFGSATAQGGLLFSGRVLMEFGDVVCSGTTCRAGSVNRDVEISPTVSVDMMPPGFTIGGLF